jgi:hypothetical protein
MRWVKKGLLFEPRENRDWMVTHAAIPLAQPKSRDRYRVYFCSRDGEGRAQIGYVEITLADPRRILRVSETPVIRLGPLGAFDESGVTSSWIVSRDHRHYQYYTGWSRGVTVPFYFFIGLAVSEDGGQTFRKVSASPVLGRDTVDPYLTASPCVLIENGTWRMWYVSGTRWAMENGQPKHYYHIKYAESKDGIHWERSGIVCIDFKSEDEHAIARPCVLKEAGGYKMWYSYRGKQYRIGYAESKDGLIWERKDEEVGIDVSASGWDTEMIEYPFVFDHEGERYMLYNGNGYGKTGIGLAVLAKEP